MKHSNNARQKKKKVCIFSAPTLRFYQGCSDGAHGFGKALIQCNNTGIYCFKLTPGESTIILISLLTDSFLHVFSLAWPVRFMSKFH